MKHLIRLVLSLLFIAGTVACNESKQFEEELYKKVFALISTDNFNIFETEHDLGEPESTGYVSVSMGGTNSTEKDLRIIMVEDVDLFNRYNNGTYDAPEKYARLLPSANYTIEGYNMTVPAGERGASLPITIRPGGLSPDSVYLISLKVDDFSEYEINPNKSDILYRVLIKNYYAAQKSSTTYNMKGEIDGVVTFGTKRMFPLTANSVRIMAGSETFEADTAVINKGSLTLEIAEDGTVNIKPFKAGRIQVEQIDDDPDYPNRFFIEDDGFRTFKSFLLYYKYKLSGDEDEHEVREELRLEFKESSINY
jgi:hypothetical protein